jgi:hypothetical protein
MPKLVHRDAVPRDVAAKIIAFIRRGNTIETAARCAGIHRDTFYDWMKRGRKGQSGYREFADQVDTAVAQAEALHVEVLREASKDDWRAAAWILERRNPRDWARQDRTVVTGPGGGPIQTIDVTKLSDDELQALLDGTYSPPGGQGG